jgi:streptogramin lyase
MLRTIVSLAAVGASALALVGGGVPAAAAAPPTAPTSCVRTFAGPADAHDSPFGITAGPGGTWYADGSTVNVIRGNQTTTFHVADPATASAGWLTRDGHQVWFADRGNGRLGSITAAGTIHEVQIPAGSAGTAAPQGIVVDQGRGLWFTDQANDRLGHYAFGSKTFAFYAVPSAFPLGLVRGGDGELYFTERSVDKVARFDTTTHLFTEWTLPTGAFPNRLAVVPDGSVWFTSYKVSAVWHIEHGYLHRFSVPGGPVGITYWHQHLWTALYDANEVGRLSLDGRLQKTYALPADANPLQIAASKGNLWTSGDTAVYAVSPRC